VALTNSSGNTVQVYEYDVYGRVGATDASHPNRFMFTGREFDKETGLYYYRARYYNPQIGRFLQTDPIGYGAGMNLYRYCRNNPLGLRDPYGRDPIDYNDTNDVNDADNSDGLSGIDMDGDGLPDSEDRDRDGDGIPDEDDELPDTPGPLYMYSTGGDNPYTWYEYASGTDAVSLSEAPANEVAAAAVTWGLGIVGDTRYGQGGTIDNFGPGDWKCNKFVHDAFVKGAGVSYPTYPRSMSMRIRGTPAYPVVANDLADRNKKMPNYAVVNGGPLKVGDIIAYPSPGMGHCAIYIGNGQVIQGGTKGVSISSIRNPHWENMVVRRYTP